MLAVERQKNILQTIHKDGFVKVNTMSIKYNVSEETIRRDLQKLESKGHLYRTYGGAYLTQVVNPDIPVDFREEVLIENKTNIAKICIELIEEGDTIMLDSSTTALHIANNLQSFHRLTVVTNSVKIVTALANHEHIRVLCSGGTLRSRSMSFIGEEGRAFYDNFYADKAFISCTSVDQNHGLTDTNEMEALIRKKMLSRASRKILIADITKFNSTAFAVIAPLDTVDTIVSDREVDKDFQQRLEELGITYLHA